MSVSPPRLLIRDRFASRNLRNCSVAWTRKSERSRAASAAISPSRSLRLVSIALPPVVERSAVIFEVWAHPLAKEHRVMALEDPLSGAIPQGLEALVGFQLVQCRVIRQFQQDDVVEIPAVGDVVPAEEPDPVLVAVLT